MPPIHVIGIGADGLVSLRPELVERIRSADFLAGGERHLRLVGPVGGERFVIKNNLKGLVEELQGRHQQQHCVVLASGDPLFYGIGTVLGDVRDSAVVHFEPGLSSMQLAFARAGIPWQDAALSSIHGRDLRPSLLPLLGRKLIGLFTQDGDSPAAVARFFLRFDLNEYGAVVAENLGGPEERVSKWKNLEDLAGAHCAPLNYLILKRDDTVTAADRGEAARHRALVPGVPDEIFARPESGSETMTRQEVRSVVLGKLTSVALTAGDTAWDIGAGLGTVSVELAVLRPSLEVLAVERQPGRAVFLRRNRERFAAHNVRVIDGSAPAALAEEPVQPRLVFIGGSGENLSAIVDTVRVRLQSRGRLAATFVTLEHLALMLQKLREWRWPFEVTEIHVARSDSLAGLTGLKPQRGVFLVCADKPEENSA